MRRWDKLYNVLNKNGAIVTFGLNALNGRTKSRHEADNLYVGNWDPSNARDFINYTIAKGQNIESFELGNELSGSGISARVDAKQYGKDLKVLRSVVDELYQSSSSKPKLLAPGGFFDDKWFADMLQTSGPGVLDVVTHHIYNLGAGMDPNLVYKIQDGYYLDQVAQTYKNVENTIKNFGPWSSAWIGESGGAYNSGGRVASHTFVNSFWYLDQLGMTSTFGHKVFCRQTLIGGNYGLLNTTTFVPNPDYYSALMWHRLMGSRVLHTTHNGPAALRAYAHCSKQKHGVTMMLINLSNTTTYYVSVDNDLNLNPDLASKVLAQDGHREEYHITAEDGNILSNVMLLNGQPLKLTATGDIPDFIPKVVPATAPLQVAPLSIAFVNFMNVNAPACA